MNEKQKEAAEIEFLRHAEPIMADAKRERDVFHTRLRELAKKVEGLSAADLKRLCVRACQKAGILNPESVGYGTARILTQVRKS